MGYQAAKEMNEAHKVFRDLFPRSAMSDLCCPGSGAIAQTALSTLRIFDEQVGSPYVRYTAWELPS